MKLYVKLIDKLNVVIKILGGTILVFLILSVFLQILDRFLPFSMKTSVFEELARFMLIWMGYITLGLALNSDQYRLVSVDFFRDMLPEGLPRVILNEIMQVLCLLFCIFMVYIGTKFIIVGSVQKAPATGIRMSWYYASEAVGFTLATLNWFAARLKNLGFAK